MDSHDNSVSDVDSTSDSFKSLEADNSSDTHEDGTAAKSGSRRNRVPEGSAPDQKRTYGLAANVDLDSLSLASSSCSSKEDSCYIPSGMYHDNFLVWAPLFKDF